MYLHGKYTFLIAFLIPTICLSENKKPNIVFVFADDLDTQYGRWIDFFPKIKNLLQDNGMTFTNAYASLGFCCPSRVSMLTGRYAHNTQIYGNDLPTGGFQKTYNLGLETSTIATWLQGAGYRTAFFGKYLNGYPGDIDSTYIPPGWTEWYGSLYNIYTQFNYSLNQNGRIVHYGSEPEDYEQDVLTKLAVNFINRYDSTSEPSDNSILPEEQKFTQPFLMWFACLSPHEPAAYAPRHENAFSEISLPRPPSFNDPNINPSTLWTHQLRLLSETKIAAMNDLYIKRMKSMLAVEDTVEALIKVLEEKGLLNNTYFWFGSDNGYHFGIHRLRAGKNTEFEEDLSLPLIVRGPGIRPNSTSDALILNIDFAPTFADIAKIILPESVASHVDGRSFLPILTSSQHSLIPWRQSFFLEHQVAPPQPFSGIHTKKMVYIMYPALKLNIFGFYQYKNLPEYYNIESDPYEMDDIAGTLDQNKLNQFNMLVQEFKTCSGPVCRSLEDNIVL